MCAWHYVLLCVYFYLYIVVRATEFCPRSHSLSLHTARSASLSHTDRIEEGIHMYVCVLTLSSTRLCCYVQYKCIPICYIFNNVCSNTHFIFRLPCFLYVFLRETVSLIFLFKRPFYWYTFRFQVAYMPFSH